MQIKYNFEKKNDLQRFYNKTNFYHTQLKCINQDFLLRDLCIIQLISSYFCVQVIATYAKPQKNKIGAKLTLKHQQYSRQ